VKDYPLEICALAFLYGVVVIRTLESSGWVMGRGKGEQAVIGLIGGLSALLAALSLMGNTTWAAICGSVIALLLAWVGLSWLRDRNDRKEESDRG
jgi:hypothetical protein